MNLKKILSYIGLKKRTVSILPDSPHKKQSKEYGHYKTIDTLIAWNWWKYRQTKELGYLLKLSDYEKIPAYNKEQLTEVVANINTEIAEYSNSNALIIYKDKRLELINLYRRYIALQDCLIAISLFENYNDAKEIVKKFFPKVESSEDLQAQLKGLLRKIEMKNAEFKEKYEANENEKIPDIYEDLETIGNWKGAVIDPMKITVKQYLVMIKNYNENAKRKNNS
jgi:hypothetical protein